MGKEGGKEEGQEEWKKGSQEGRRPQEEARPQPFIPPWRPPSAPHLLRGDHSKSQPTGAGLGSGFTREKGGDPHGQNRVERGLRATKTLRTPRPRCESPEPGFEPATSRPAAALRLRRATARRGGAGRGGAGLSGAAPALITRRVRAPPRPVPTGSASPRVRGGTRQHRRRKRGAGCAKMAAGGAAAALRGGGGARR